MHIKKNTNNKDKSDKNETRKNRIKEANRKNKH